MFWRELVKRPALHAGSRHSVRDASSPKSRSTHGPRGEGVAGVGRRPAPHDRCAKHQQELVASSLKPRSRTTCAVPIAFAHAAAWDRAPEASSVEVLCMSPRLRRGTHETQPV